MELGRCVWKEGKEVANTEIEGLGWLTALKGNIKDR